jgi:hypothetical protein
MTSQSPRIYLYKITFEEVPYYYYGVHKEKNYNEKYFGTPITHKWCWELYTSKKQILQLFDFTDEGWLEAQEVEKRLIKPVFNTDKWCLNEHCGGLLSFSSSSRGGKIAVKKNKEQNIGIFSMTAEELSEAGKKGGSISGKLTYERGTGIHALTSKQRAENVKKSHETQKELGVGLWGLKKRDIQKRGGKKTAEHHRKNGTGFFGITPEERIERGKKGGKIVSSQMWECCETGFVANAGNLARYQRARGIDTSKRKRIL